MREVSHSGGEPVIRDLTTTIERGDKVGIIGLNGSGKTTLLRLLLGDLDPLCAPHSGMARHVTELQVAYFEGWPDGRICRRL